MADTTRFSSNFLDISLDDVPHLTPSPGPGLSTADETQATGGAGTEAGLFEDFGESFGESFGDSFVQSTDVDEGGAPCPSQRPSRTRCCTRRLSASQTTSLGRRGRRTGKLRLETADSMSSLGQISHEGDETPATPGEVAAVVSPGAGLQRAGRCLSLREGS